MVKTMTEYQMQCSLVAWARLKGLPLIAIPNGGKRTAWEGARQKRMGLFPGVSDLFLPVARSPYHGFWIELKTVRNKPTIEQVFWMELMRREQYKAEWYNDLDVVMNEIETYLGG